MVVPDGNILGRLCSVRSVGTTVDDHAFAVRAASIAAWLPARSRYIMQRSVAVNYRTRVMALQVPKKEEKHVEYEKPVTVIRSCVPPAFATLVLYFCV